MDFTREPVIQTVITPKEGCKLVVRSSKGLNQEEYFVDAVEVVSFGSAFFFRSLEKPKNFLLPVTDYEVLEVREARMVLKHVGVDRSIKIGGGREGSLKPVREPQIADKHIPESESEEIAETASEEVPATTSETRAEGRSDKKRDRRRHYRRRRSRDEKDEGTPPSKEEWTGDSTLREGSGSQERVSIPEPEKASSQDNLVTPGLLTTLLPPPPTLISETIARYREDALFKEAFYSRKEKEEQEGEKEEQEAVEFSDKDKESQAIHQVVDESPSHPVIPPEEPKGKNDEDQWNFSEELSNNNKNG